MAVQTIWELRTNVRMCILVLMMIVMLFESLCYVQGGPKMAQFILNLLTLSNINRFSKSFHCQNQDKICNNNITKDPTTPQVYRDTTL